MVKHIALVVQRSGVQFLTVLPIFVSSICKTKTYRLKEFNNVLEYTLIHDTVHIYSLSYSYTPYQLVSDVGLPRLSLLVSPATFSVITDHQNSVFMAQQVGENRGH